MKLSKNSPKGKNEPQKKGPFGLNLNLDFGKKAPKKIETVDPETFVFTPTLPKVNAIPTALVEKYEIKGVVRKFGFAGAGLVAVLALVLVGGNVFIGGLNTQLDSIKAEEAQLASQVETLLPYEEYKNAISAKRTALSDEVSSDVNMGNIYRDFYTTAQANNVTLTSFSVAQNTGDAATSSCSNPEPFAETGDLIGCITISGKGASADGARLFINQLVGDNSRYTNPFISSVGITEEGSTFDATVFFTSALYSGQYSELQLSLEDLLAQDAAENGTGEVQTGDIAQVSYKSAVTLQAQQLVPELAEEDLVSIDNTALNACTTNDVDTAIQDISNILTSRLPANDNNLDAYTQQLTTTLTQECQGA